MYLTDGTRVVRIEMQVWEGDGYSPDWSRDFFDAGCLPYNDEDNVYTVGNIDYCIDRAQDWENESDNNFVFWDEIVSQIKLKDGHILHVGDWLTDGDRIIEVGEISDVVRVAEMSMDDNGDFVVTDNYTLTRNEIRNFKSEF